MYDFDGGQIDLKYTVENQGITLDYALHGDGKYKNCISNKRYLGFKQAGYIGITSGNPLEQNVNDIDVHKIDFFNMNPDYYKHDAHEIVSQQEYYKRDEQGFVGKTVYPWSAKLNTIEMGKVAFDVLELKRNQREYLREQFHKSLNIVNKDDDIMEVIFKLNEQMRLMNDDLVTHISLQMQKKQSIQQFEKILLKDSDYKHFIDVVKEDDK